MTTKMLAVRTPESMHTYLKVQATKQGLNIQTLVNQILHDYQAKDTDYQADLNQSVTEALDGLAQLTHEQEADHV